MARSKEYIALLAGIGRLLGYVGSMFYIGKRGAYLNDQSKNPVFIIGNAE